MNSKDEMPLKCPICKKWDKRKNLVNAKHELNDSPWIGSAHSYCIRQYNKIKTHLFKYSILEYDENDKFLGEVTAI